MNNTKVIEIDNGGKITLEFDDRGITVIDEREDLPSGHLIDDRSLIALVDLYEALIYRDETSAYILDNFSRTALEQTGAIDCVKECKIINWQVDKQT